MAILKGFSPSNTISPTIHIRSNDVSERWHPPSGDDEWCSPIRPKNKSPQFTVEIIEEEEWK